MSYTFQYALEEKNTCLNVRFEGRLMDNSRTEEIKKKLDAYLEKGIKSWIIDLSALEFLNSMGLNLLIQLQTKMRIQNGKMIIYKPNQRVTDLIKLTKLDLFFTMCHSEDELQKHFSNPI